MKKILLILFLLWPLKVFAHDFELRNTNYAICDEEGKKYPVHYLTYKTSPVYFLNLNDNYNYALGTYQEYDEWEDDYFITQYLWLEPVINYQMYYEYHMQFLTRLLWEDLYSGKSFYFCGEEEGILERKEAEYKIVKNRSYKVLEGINLFNEDHIQYEHESVTYFDDLLEFYTLFSDDGLDVIVDNKQVIIKGEAGEYNLVFNLKDRLIEYEKTFTDGKNRLATVHHPPMNFYNMHITIISNEEINEEISNDNQQDEEELMLKEKEVYINTDDETKNTISFVAKNTFVSFLS